MLRRERSNDIEIIFDEVKYLPNMYYIKLTDNENFGAGIAIHLTFEDVKALRDHLNKVIEEKEKEKKK